MTSLPSVSAAAGKKAVRFARADLISGRGQISRASGTTFSIDIKLVGWRTLIQDQFMSAELMRALATHVTQIAGERVRDSAINDAPFSDRTGDTRNSMRENDPEMRFPGGDIEAHMGPTTFYAPWLEFGWSRAGNIYSFPFMIPASFKHQREFEDAHVDIMAVIAGHQPRTIGGPIGDDSRVTGSISVARKWLYTTEKALGDIMVIAGSPALRAIRGGLLTAAKELGDMQAIMNGAVGTRIATRISGRVTGRALGYSRTVFASKVYSGFPGGGGSTSVGTRAYNRIVGRATRPIAISGGKFG